MHPHDEDLLALLDGELDAARVPVVQGHVDQCPLCRDRSRVLAATLRDVTRLHQERTLPSKPRHAFWRPAVAAAFAGMAIGIAALLSLSERPLSAGSLPDARLTPGAARPLSRDQVCIATDEEEKRAIPMEVAHRVFAEYRITQPQPGLYEMDFLITPTLGGTDDVRNLWPQRYNDNVWSSRVKDALEDHLRSLVCSGQLDVATAQREIATDWIAAYRKYFNTRHPLPEHSLFVKDAAWQ